MGVLWFLIGLVIGGLIFWLVTFVKERSIKLSGLQWLGVVAWGLWIIFCIAFIVTSIGEGEPRAAGIGALIFGGIAALSSIWVRKVFSIN